MHRIVFAISALSLATAAAQTPPSSAEPVLQLKRAEKLLQKEAKQVEDAALLLWQALEQLGNLQQNPELEAATLSARSLLQENDPREAERRRVFAAVARMQVDLAAAYRSRKWFEAAAKALETANRYDRDVGSKEQSLLDAARSKPAAPGTTAAQPCPLLQKGNALLASDGWRVVGDAIECRAPDGKHLDWVCKATHEDNEVVVEFRAAEPEKENNATVAVGLHERSKEESYSGYRCQVDYLPEEKRYGVIFFEILGMSYAELGRLYVAPVPKPDGYHRLAVQVRGNRLRGQIDQCEPLEVVTREPVRGHVGLLQGISNAPTCAVRFRNLRVDPLPADQLPAEPRAKTAAERQNAITRAVEQARSLLAQKRPEAASLQLHEVMGRLAALEDGVVRDNQRKAIEPLLAQHDPLVHQRKKAARDGAGELANLAKQYADAGMVRAAVSMADRAAAFDPEGQAANVAALRDKVQQWNVAQATDHAAELEPPIDDGAELREWFEKGKWLGHKFAIDRNVARVDLGPDGHATLFAQPLAKTLRKASIHVRLPATGTMAGLYFDVVDQTQCGLAAVSRNRDGLRLAVFARLANKWVPVMHRDLPLDTWRLDAWHQLTVEVTEAGVVVRCGSIVLKVSRKVLGKMTGEVGLFAWNEGKDPVTVELRAFRAGL